MFVIGVLWYGAVLVFVVVVVVVVAMEIGAKEEFRLRLDCGIKVLKCHVEMIGENLRRTVTVV